MTHKVNSFFLSFSLNCCSLRMNAWHCQPWHQHALITLQKLRVAEVAAALTHTRMLRPNEWNFVHYIFNSNALAFILLVLLLFHSSLASFFFVSYHEFITRTFTMVMTVTLEMGVRKEEKKRRVLEMSGRQRWKAQKCEHVLTKWIVSSWRHEHVPRKIHNRQNKLALPRHLCETCVCSLLPPLCVWHISMSCIQKLFSLQTTAISYFSTIEFNEGAIRTHFTHKLHDFAVNYVYISPFQWFTVETLNCRK